MWIVIVNKISEISKKSGKERCNKTLVIGIGCLIFFNKWC